ncbi:MAG: MOSC domain-containing protein [Gemmatimonadales bacterium]
MSSVIDSLSLGDPSRRLSTDALIRRFSALAPSPRDAGSVGALVVRGPDHGRRETPESVLLSVAEGMPGDSWGRSVDRTNDAQVTAMEVTVADMIANGQPWSLFGDQLFLDLDLSSENLPVGSSLLVGTAVLEVTPKPHRGCAKYQARFGPDALRFISDPERRARNLRGIYLRVVSEGWVRVGDSASVVRRA